MSIIYYILSHSRFQPRPYVSPTQTQDVEIKQEAKKRTRPAPPSSTTRKKTDRKFHMPSASGVVNYRQHYKRYLADKNDYNEIDTLPYGNDKGTRLLKIN